jgi:hypothetical protein
MLRRRCNLFLLSLLLLLASRWDVVSVTLAAPAQLPGWTVHCTKLVHDGKHPCLPRVYALLQVDNLVVIGGNFDRIEAVGGGSVARRNLALIDLTTGMVHAWSPDPDGVVRTLLALEGHLYLGGDFGAVDGEPRAHLAALALDTGKLTDWTPEADGSVAALATNGHTIYAGGAFGKVNATLQPSLAAIHPTESGLVRLTRGLDGPVHALLATDDTLFVGGDFSQVDGQARANLAALDLTQALIMPARPFNPDVDGPVHALLLHEQRLYLGGAFAHVRGEARRNLAAVHTTSGALLLPFTPASDGPVRAMLRDGDALLIGGDFDTLAGQPSHRVARFDLRFNWIDSRALAVQGTVRALALVDDALMVGVVTDLQDARQGAPVEILDPHRLTPAASLAPTAMQPRPNSTIRPTTAVTPTAKDARAAQPTARPMPTPISVEERRTQNLQSQRQEWSTALALYWTISAILIVGWFLYFFNPNQSFPWRGRWHRRHTSLSRLQGAVAPAPLPQVSRAAIAANVPLRAASPPSLPVTAAIIDPARQVRCAVCGASTDRDDLACAACGLVFLSRVPAALPALPGYTLLRPLSIGGMSVVYLARRTGDGRLCALKTLASVDGPQPTGWQQDALRCLEHEATLLAWLEHPAIVPRIEWIRSGVRSVLVLDYVAGDTLEQRIATWEADGHARTRAEIHAILGYGIAVAELLITLTQRSELVVHGDIKPANLLLPHGDAKARLLDWGSAVVGATADQVTPLQFRFGTPGYAAPELYQGIITPCSDIYGLAATLYHALSGDDPTQHPGNFPALNRLPTAIHSALTPMLAADPQRRPSAEGALRQLCELRDQYLHEPEQQAAMKVEQRR